MKTLKELQDALRAAAARSEELEGKVEAEKDEAKKAALVALYQDAVTAEEAAAKAVEGFKTKAARKAKTAELTKPEEVEDKTAQLDSEPGDGALAGKVSVPDSEHNRMMDTKARDDAARSYIMAPHGEATPVLLGLAAKSEKLFEAITVERKDGRQKGVRPPSYIQNFIHAKMAGWNPASIRAALQGKANENVLARDSSGTQSGGGSLVPDQFEASLYRLPELDARLMDLCYVKTAVGGSAYFPKLTQSTNRFGVKIQASTEGNAKPKSNPNFTRVSVTPGEASGLAIVSHKELRVNNVGLEAELAWMFRGAWNEFINKQILQKSDPNSAFTGINTDEAIAAGVVTVRREAAGAVSWADLMGLVFGIEAGAMASARLILKSGATGAMASIAKLDDTNNRPVFQNLLSASWAGGAQNPPSIAGCPFITTPDNDAAVGARGDVICGDFRNYAVAVDQDITIDRSDDFMFDRDMAVYRIIGYAGGLPLGYTCFSVLADLATVSSSSHSASSNSVSASSGADDNE